MRFGAQRHLHRTDSFLADAASQDAQKYAEPDNDDAAPVAEPESSSAFDFFSSRTPNASSTSRRVSFAGSVTGGNVAASRRAGCARGRFRWVRYFDHSWRARADEADELIQQSSSAPKEEGFFSSFFARAQH